jgi:hypothetical protein
MAEVRDWLTFMLGLCGLLTSTVLAFLVYSLSKQTNRAQIDKAITGSYGLLIEFRASHPEVLKLSRTWDSNRFTTIYTQSSQRDTQWVHYYTYAELCLSFANNVLYAWRSHLLDRSSYERHYQPLIKLLLTENEPFVSSALPESDYISSYIREFRQEQQAKGWNWHERHLRLAQSNSEPDTA